MGKGRTAAFIGRLAADGEALDGAANRLADILLEAAGGDRSLGRSLAEHPAIAAAVGDVRERGEAMRKSLAMARAWTYGKDS